jgi:hypothetical protein
MGAPGHAPDALARVTRRLASDTAGIPLLAIELLHAITLGLEPDDSGVVWPAPARTLSQTLPADLPDSVVAAVRVGFRGLTPAAQKVLAGMTVLPERATEEHLGRAVELPLDEARRALDELEWRAVSCATSSGCARHVGRVAQRGSAARNGVVGKRRAGREGTPRGRLRAANRRDSAQAIHVRGDELHLVIRDRGAGLGGHRDAGLRLIGGNALQDLSHDGVV